MDKTQATPMAGQPVEIRCGKGTKAAPYTWQKAVVVGTSPTRMVYRWLDDLVDQERGPVVIEREGSTWRRVDVGFDPFGLSVTETNIDPETVVLDGVYGEYREITASLAYHQIYPIVVLAHQERPEGWPEDEPVEGYPIVAGRKRTVSARSLGRPLRAYICSDEMAAARIQATIALAENVRGKNPLTDARAIVELGDDLDFVSEISGLNKTQIEARTRLLDLAPELRTLLEKRELSLTAAKLLLGPRSRPFNLTAQRKAWKMAERAAKEAEKSRPNIYLVRQAVRQVRGDRQPQPALPFHTITPEDRRPDPVQVAASIRALIPDFDGQAIPVVALETAADILEGTFYRVEDEEGEPDA